MDGFAFELVELGASRALAQDDALRRQAVAGAPILLVVGGHAGARARAAARLLENPVAVVIVELETECLAFHAGDAAPANLLGFARFGLGRCVPTSLVELVQTAGTAPEALRAARQVFERCGLDVSVCSDTPGRIVDNLLRPFLNSALRAVDEGLATAGDLDLTLRMGLGHARGPLELLRAEGLARHADISDALHAFHGDAAFLPAPVARSAAQRRDAGLEP